MAEEKKDDKDKKKEGSEKRELGPWLRKMIRRAVLVVVIPYFGFLTTEKFIAWKATQKEAEAKALGLNLREVPYRIVVVKDLWSTRVDIPYGSRRMASREASQPKFVYLVRVNGDDSRIYEVDANLDLGEDNQYLQYRINDDQPVEEATLLITDGRQNVASE